MSQDSGQKKEQTRLGVVGRWCGLVHHVLIHWTPTFGPSGTEFVRLDSGIFMIVVQQEKIDHIFIGYGGLPYVHPLAVHLKLFLMETFIEGTRDFLLYEFFGGTLPSCLIFMGYEVVAYRILLSAPVPLVLELIGTWLRLTQGVYGTNGLGQA